MPVAILTGVLAGAGLGGTAFTVGATAVTFAQLGAYAITAGALVGGTLALKALSPKQHLDTQLTLKQASPPRTRAYGRVLLAGSYFFFLANGPALVSGYALCEGPIDAIERHWFNAVFSPDTGLSGHADQWPWFSNVKYDAQLGATDQAVQTPISFYFPWWTPEYRLRGIANTVVTCTLPSNPSQNFPKVFPNGAPQYLAEARTSLVYDPRTGVTAWSDNAALCIRDYLAHPDGLNIPASRIDDTSFIAMADLCDQDVPLAAGGTEKRYRLWGTYTLDEPPIDVLNRMLKTCDGEIYPLADGTIGLRGGQWTAPTTTITPDMRISTQAARGVNKLAAFNQLRIRYTEPSQQYQQIEGDPWDDIAAQEAAGEVIPEDFDIVMVPSYTQGQRLAKIFMAKKNPAWIVTETVNLSGLTILGERTSHDVNPDLAIDDDMFINGYTINDDGATCKISLGSLSADAYEWSTAEERNVAVTPTGGATGPFIPSAPTGLTLSLVTASLGGGASGIQISASVTPPTDTTLSLNVQYRPVGSSTWLDMPTVDNVAYTALSGLVTSGTTYEVQAAFVSFAGNVGAFTSAVDIFSTPLALGPELQSIALGVSIDEGVAVLPAALTDDEGDAATGIVMTLDEGIAS